MSLVMAILEPSASVTFPSFKMCCPRPTIFLLLSLLGAATVKLTCPSRKRAAMDSVTMLMTIACFFLDPLLSKTDDFIVDGRSRKEGIVNGCFDDCSDDVFLMECNYNGEDLGFYMWI